MQRPWVGKKPARLEAWRESQGDRVGGDEAGKEEEAEADLKEPLLATRAPFFQMKG